MPTFSDASRTRLETCDPRLQEVLREAIKYVDFVVIEGFRSRDAQNKAVSEGKSQKPWPTGNHNASPSRAVDIAPYYPDVKLDWNDVVAFGRLMGMIQLIGMQKGIKLRFGLDWDGDWHTTGKNDPNEHFLDAPHVELVDP
jgi:peptidoglycan L-alanyl-D-glutamate endopeptidase CwlK